MIKFGTFQEFIGNYTHNELTMKDYLKINLNYLNIMIINYHNNINHI